jgi:hypothetical protein
VLKELEIIGLNGLLSEDEKTALKDACAAFGAA